ncbi:hypothetical protein [Plasmodium yoelii yoelii]|uniref:Uncharacterized protein n=1 Tax=Plasmodium yoelii yoelii TaxID=73239 RepID=Q7RR12_PLAYO|nr:hypothetical protein [Plasmodium yoelii yoelii]
MHLTFLITQ